MMQGALAGVVDKRRPILCHSSLTINGELQLQCQLVCHAEYDDDGAPDPATFKVMVDGGTEGLKGHARVIIPGLTPCFDCTLWLFPPQTKFPLCTLAETPR